MADDELAALRAKRMAELQGQLGANQGVNDLQQQQQRQEAMERENEMRRAMMSQLLDQSARARLSSIALVKPEKAKMIESMLIQMAQSGQLPGKIGEASLVNLLEKVNDQTKKKTKVIFNRRRFDDSDDDDLLT